MAEHVLLYRVLCEPDQFYGRQVALIGYVVLKSDAGAAVYPEYGADRLVHPRLHVPALWFDLPKTYREQAYDFHHKYVEIHGTLRPAPPRRRPDALDGPPPDRHSGWHALLDPVTYMLPLTEHSMLTEVRQQVRREGERLLGEGVTCPFCASSSPPRLLESSLLFVCQDCGRSFAATDIAR
jgi:hypothetical protein